MTVSGQHMFTSGFGMPAFRRKARWIGGLRVFLSRSSCFFRFPVIHFFLVAIN